MAHVKGYRGGQGRAMAVRGKGGYTLDQLNRLLERRDSRGPRREETEAQRLARLERVRRYEESLRG